MSAQLQLLPVGMSRWEQELARQEFSTVGQFIFKEEVEQQSSDAFAACFAVLDRDDLSSSGWRKVILESRECNRTRKKDLQRVWYLKDERERRAAR